MKKRKNKTIYVICILAIIIATALLISALLMGEFDLKELLSGASSTYTENGNSQINKNTKPCTRPQTDARKMRSDALCVCICNGSRKTNVKIRNTIQERKERIKK